MCPLETCSGIIENCQFCGQKESCIVLAIFEKLEKLETAANSQPVH
jgi:hypothetical protein